MWRPEPLLLALALLPTLAQAAPGIAGPEVFKVADDTRALCVADIDGDGRQDLALLDNAHARVDLLLQLPADHPARRAIADDQRHWRPRLSDARFVQRELPTGSRMYALALGDLDGDGRTDLALTAKAEGLALYYQQADGGWRAGPNYSDLTPTQDEDALAILDLDGHGAHTLLMLGAKELVLLRHLKGQAQAPERYPLSEGEHYAPLALDLDADGRQDLLYLARNSDHALRVRLQGPDGRLGAERRYPLRSPRGPLQPLGSTAHGQQLVSVQGRTGVVEWLTLGDAGEPAPLDLTPLVHAVPASLTSASLYALGDLDGDGRDDLVAADPTGAQLLLYRRLPEGGFSGPDSYPAFSGLVAIAAADSDGDGRAELYLASRNERVVGTTRLDTQGRLPFPTPLPLDGTPLGLALLPHPSGMRLVVLNKQEKEVELTTLQATSAGWQAGQTLTLPKERAEPSGLLTLDLDQNGQPELLVLRARRPALWLPLGADGQLTLHDGFAGFGNSLLDDLELNRLDQGDLDGDGHAELLHSATGFVRALRVVQDALTVSEQVNAADTQQRLSSALPADLDGDGLPELLLLDERGEQLQLLRRDPQGVLRPREHLDLGGIEPLGSRLLREPDGSQSLLYLGRDRFLLLPLTPPRQRLGHTGIHSPERDEVSYQRVAAGDLDGDGRAELLLLDNTQSHSLELLVTSAEGWQSRLFFTLFEGEGGEGEKERREPRELRLVDVTGDGRDDLLLLVHDRVLLYRGVAE